MAQSSSEALARPGGEEWSHTSLPEGGHGPGWSKVPQVTALFWGVKVLTTGMGETASDYLGRTLGPIPAGSIGLAGLVALLILQFRSTRYRPWIYWSAIVMVSVFGTMAADVVHVVAGIPYTVSVIAFSVGLAAILTAWCVSEGTLSIHSIRTRRRETFYWATVLATFALGTAVGDLTAGTLRWGYLPSGLLFTALIAVPALSGRFLGLNAVAAFWWAYVLTRPLGASFADWMGVSASRGGLGWGTGPVTLTLIVPIVLLVGYLAITHKDTPPEQQAVGATT
ncbi:Uncharacterized membrane-anchored protein [Streptomyces sp. 2323.1]|uniref:COG4705 family protein n=1 Tax=Streptomyces sp. 2323.1 TaxID=1938841 RepID=UPI000BB67D65|nr:hypothetical protein [Streptomyces sp. 2323.1]SOE10995.1 Uncharacterized membrane-anchored protein [Streptomyces sp. 2323.1]